MKLAIIGGHISPALSVIDALPKDVDVVFIGRKHAIEGDKARSFEEQEVTRCGIPFYPITTGRLQRKITRHTLLSLAKFPGGVKQAYDILRKARPDVVLSFGSYVSLPVVIAAKTLGIPVVIHEQTLEAGLANKLASHFATKICISWESSRKFFSRHKTVLTGNPIREFQIFPRSGIQLRWTNFKFSRGAGSSFAGQISNGKKRPFIYVTGGSLGSHAINLLIEGCINELLDEYTVLHQTGDAKEFQDFDRLKTIRELLPVEKRKHYLVEKFISADDVASILKTADLVIARSGINTVTELLYFEKPSLLIPLPYAQRNEQMKNAQFLQKCGLASVLEQHSLSSQRLLESVRVMMHSLDAFLLKDKTLHETIEKASGKIVEEVVDVAQAANNKKTKA